MAVLIFCLITLYVTHIMCNDISKPHIVCVTANDFGWNDISLHGSDLVYTTNIDMIGIQGIKIHNYYTDCQGTPSMSALFTGKYPMKMGTQGPSIRAAEDRGVPISERLLPFYLKGFGYVTHLVGKWELGKSRTDYLPMYRGFDTFFGTKSDVDYYSYEHLEEVNGTTYFGLDLYDNLKPAHNEEGHLTNILTNRAVKLIEEHNTSAPMYLHVAHAAAHIGGGSVHLQATTEDIAANNHIAHPSKRLHAALVTGVDKSVGKIINALAEKNILNDTIFIFMSEQGAPVTDRKLNYGSNLPLKGGKATPWEGGVRSIAMVWHANITPNIYKGLFHVTDWVPTIIGAVADETNNSYIENLDGVNQWKALTNNEESKRNGTVIAVDDLNEWGAYRDGDFKIIIGNVPESLCGYYGHDLNKIKSEVNRPTYEEELMNSTTAKVFNEKLNLKLDIAYAVNKRNSCNINKRITEQNNTEMVSKNCIPTKVQGCLFNISADPEEARDLWNEYPEIVQQLSVQFRLQWTKLVPRPPVTFDPRADPQNSNYIWQPWVDNAEEIPSTNVSHRFPLEMSDQEFQYYLNLNLDVMSEKLTGYMRSMSDTLVNSMTRIFGSSIAK